MGPRTVGRNKKTLEEISREYFVQKWGSHLKWVFSSDESIIVNAANDFLFKKSNKTLLYDNREFPTVTIQEANIRYLNLITKTLIKYMPTTALVELGAGFGNVILNLSKRKFLMMFL